MAEENLLSDVKSLRSSRKLRGSHTMPLSAFIRRVSGKRVSMPDYQPLSIDEELDHESQGSLKISVAGMVCFFLVGQLIGYFKGWTLIDALYFTVTVLTTVGYGDLDFGSQDDNWKLVGSLFIAFGVVMFAITWTTLFDRFFKEEQTAVRLFAEERAHGKEQDMQVGFVRRSLRQVLAPRKDHGNAGEIGFARSLQEEAKGRLKVSLAFALTQNIALFVVVAVVSSFTEGWGFRESLYWSVSTASTVGFGDVVPITQGGRFIATVLLLLSVTIWTQTLGVLASYRHTSSEVGARHKVLTQFGTTLTKEEFRTLSQGREMSDLRLCSRPDNVTKDEFCLFLLVKLGRVSREELRACQDAFNALDIDHTGTLDWQDVQEHEERRHAMWGLSGKLNPADGSPTECSNCKSELMQDAQFCRKCGKPRHTDSLRLDS